MALFAAQGPRRGQVRTTRAFRGAARASAVGLISTLLIATAAPAIAAVPPPVDPATATEAAAPTAGQGGAAEAATPTGPPAASPVPAPQQGNEAAGANGAEATAQPSVSDTVVPQPEAPPSAAAPSSPEIQPQEAQAPVSPPEARILAPPTTTLVAAPATTAPLGTSVSFTATMTDPAATTTPTGTVDFTAGGTTISGCGSVTATETTPGVSAAVCTTTSLAAGTFDVVANYSGDLPVGTFDPSSATITGYIVTEVAPTVTVVSANPATSAELGASVAFTATVTGVAGAPAPSGGTVSFTADGSAITGCTAVALPTGLTCSTSTLTLGAHSIVASYNGTADPNYLDGPASAGFSYSITEATPTVTVVSANPPTPGVLAQPVTFTATVTGAAGAPSGGTVSFTADASAIAGCTAVALPAGLACTTSALTGGSHTIVASYDGTADTNYLSAASGSFSYAIAEATPTVTLVANPATPAGLGDSVDFTATVTGVGGAPDPSGGTVSFTANSAPITGCSALPLATGQAVCTTTALPAGTHSIVASYDGTADPNYGNAASAPVSHQVAEAAPTVSVSAAPAAPGPVALGTSVTFTVTVAPVTNGPAPSGGTVIFTEGLGGPAVAGCAPVTLPAAPVQCVTTALAGGSHSIVVSYNGTSDPNYTNANSAALSYSVTEGAPTVTLVASPSGSVPLGTPVTFTATVTGVAGGPAPAGGTVSFTQGVGGPAVPGCAPVTLPATPQCVTSGLTVGAHLNIVASYNGGGDVSYTNDDSTLLSITITPAAPTVTLAASPTTSAQLGGAVVFTATVTGVAGTPPGGTVNFTETGVTIGTCAAVPVSSGTAGCTTSGLGLGSHAIVATYSGDTNYLGGSATIASYSITQASPSVTLTAAPAASAVIGSSVSFTASVAGVAGVSAPTGTVSFTVDGAAVAACPAVTLPATPVCTTSALAIGPHTVVATYSGNTDYLAGSATVAAYQVTARPSAVTVVVSPASPVDAGTAVTLTAVVTGDGSGIPPSGTVRFAAGVSALATVAGCEAVPVNAIGQAVCTTTTLPAGSVRLVALYSGDPVYAPSSGEISGYVVNSGLALTGTGEEAGTGTETGTEDELANTGVAIDRMLLGALLLLGAGAGFVAFGSVLSGRRRTQSSGPNPTRHNRR